MLPSRHYCLESTQKKISHHSDVSEISTIISWYILNDLKSKVKQYFVDLDLIDCWLDLIFILYILSDISTLERMGFLIKTKKDKRFRRFRKTFKCVEPMEETIVEIYENGRPERESWRFRRFQLFTDTKSVGIYIFWSKIYSLWLKRIGTDTYMNSKRVVIYSTSENL